MYVAYRSLRDALEHLELDLVSTEWRYDLVKGCPVCDGTAFPLTDGTLIR